MKYLRRICGLTRLDEVKISKIREDLNVKATITFIKRRKLGGSRHVQRMVYDRPTKLVAVMFNCFKLISDRRGNHKKSLDIC